MSKLAFAVAVLALGVAGWQAFETQSLRKDLRAQQDTLAELRSGLYERDVDRLRRAPMPDASGGDAAFREAAGGDAARVGLRTAEPALVGSAATPEGLAKQVADLQKRMEEAEKRAEVAKALPGTALQVAETFLGGAFYTDVESASKHLKLEEHQKTDLQRIVDATRAELKELHALQNDDGTTWNDAMKIKFEGGGDGDGVISFATGFGKLEKFKQTKIPGSNETFGEADNRIRRAGRDRARRLLTPEQAKAWDKAQTDPLFGGSGMGSFAVSFAPEGAVVEEPASAK